MKKLATILLASFFAITTSIGAIPEWLKATGVYTTSIVLNAAGDALNSSGSKTLGHALNATSTGVLLATPFILKGQKSEWGYHAVMYIGIRFFAFDPTYNMVRGLPVGYIGNSSVTDKFWQAVNPPTGTQMFARGIVLSMTMSFSINGIGK